MLLAQLAWHAFPRAALELEANAHRSFSRVALALGIVAVVGLASPGSPRRRLFAAGMFPLLGLWAMLAVSAGMEFTDSMRLPEYPLAEAVLRGLALGLLISILLPLPAALLYRGSAVSVAVLSVLFAMAQADASVARSSLVDYAGLFWQLEPFLCALGVVALSTYVCDRLQGHSLK